MIIPAGSILELDERYIRALLQPAEPLQQADQTAGSIAVLPLSGVLMGRSSFFGTSLETFTRQFRELVNDGSVRAIVIDTSSPGGSIQGVAEAHAAVFAARKVKPVVAVAHHTMASAAYHIASAAETIVATPSAEVGSIGVYATREDISGALDQAKIKVHLIRAGKYKAEGAPFMPATDDELAYLQGQVNDAYDRFVEAVAMGRGVAAADVRNGFGEGRSVGARKALQLGMLDHVATLDDVVARLAERLQ